MKTATIPMPGDLIELVGEAAQMVENRSLLLDKFVFHKQWPQENDSRGPVKWDEASRWSFFRIAEGASQLLTREATEKLRKAEGRNVEPRNAERFKAEAQIAKSLSSIRWDDKELSDMRAQHTRRFLSLFRNAYGDRALIEVAQLEGRLAIHLANSLIPNAGICLDRLFGLPFIPGSSIKGVCRHAALTELRDCPESEKAERLRVFCQVFGTAENDFTHGDLKTFARWNIDGSQDRKGAVCFLPAYPNTEAKIVVDLTNVHCPEYYRTGAPQDQSKENPRPNPFPVVEAGAQFAFCLVLSGSQHDVSLLEHAKRWLRSALTIQGLGAKTASGYGWFSIQEDVRNKLLSAADNEESQRQNRAASASLNPDPDIVEMLRTLKPDALAGILNKHSYEPKFWPVESNPVYMVSLFEFVKTEASHLMETKNGKKAMNNISQHLNRPVV